MPCFTALQDLPLQTDDTVRSRTCKIALRRCRGRVFDLYRRVEALLVEHHADDDEEDDARHGQADAHPRTCKRSSTFTFTFSFVGYGLCGRENDLVWIR